jgi:hypothetical protein
MTDREGFLLRWSRRKRNAADAEPDRAEAASPEESVRADAPQAGQKEKALGTPPDAAEGKNEAAEPAFDLSKLPSIDSITAETDIRAFLAPGVPPALTQAALRRAWSVDPKIRDFIEVAENQWDFTAPGVPGFDLSPPTGDIKRMLAQILGDPPADEVREAKENERSEGAPASSIAPDSHRDVNEPAQSAISGQKDSAQQVAAVESDSADVATQKSSVSRDEPPAPKRGHGGAMPR